MKLSNRIFLCFLIFSLLLLCVSCKNNAAPQNPQDILSEEHYSKENTPAEDVSENHSPLGSLTTDSIGSPQNIPDTPDTDENFHLEAENEQPDFLESHTDTQASYSDTQTSYPVSDDNNPGNSNAADHTEQKAPAADDPIFQENPQSSPTITESIAAAIPCTIADGTLRITSLFQSTLLNPDCQDEYGDNIASLEILNISEHFIAEASFTITLDDGTVIPFSVTDLPAGKTVWVFAGNNAAIPINAICKNITCSVQTRDSVSLIQEGITCSVQNTEITVTNQTGTPLDHLTVRGHCLFENIYFGGKTYTYEISRLDAASSIVLSADDCIMGTIEIIGIDQTP